MPVGGDPTRGRGDAHGRIDTVSMQAHLALLRGINVGRGNRVPMADLRALLGTLGCREVTTLLNSGNAVFRAPAGADAHLGAALTDALAEAMGVGVPVMVKSRAQFEAAVGGAPVRHVPDPSRLLLAFAATPAALAGLPALASLLVDGERFEVGADGAWLHCPDGIRDSAAAAALLGRLGCGVTTRNGATVLKIAAALAVLDG